jgi:hypothetical protein
MQINAGAARPAPETHPSPSREPAVDNLEATLSTLAQDLAKLAIKADEPAISRRLTEMAAEVRALVARERPDSPIYDSATFFLHTVRPDTNRVPYADDHATESTQRN